MICIVDYGVGNLASVQNMLRKAGARSIITNDVSKILSAEKIILPGVGHYDHAMKMLNSSGLRSALETVAMDLKRPVLGICLGAQILGTTSEEGCELGLGWIDMQCKKIPLGTGIRVPHMGWNQIIKEKNSELLELKTAESRYYFAHSYYMKCADFANVLATVDHGINFPCVVQKGNIYGAQFHPEKSLGNGLAFLNAFAHLGCQKND
jgi:glutamine amidotransferase